MSKNHYDAHSYYLSQFTRRDHLMPAFKKVNKGLEDLVGIITEPEYMNHSMQHITMCDYLFLFDNRYCVPAELKGSVKQRRKATSQLKSGKLFAEEYMQQRVESGLFIVYHHGDYIVKKVDL